MCIEDIRMGRRSYNRTTVVAMVGGSTIEWAPSPNRVGITFQTRASNGLVTPRSAGEAPTTAGQFINSAVPPYMYRVEEWGQAVPGPWTIVDASGGGDWLVIEVFLEDQ